MALGISEASLQRAYAPTDWGSFYKGMDDVFVKAEKEKAAEKKLAQKEYYTTSATLAKNMGGIRTEDVPEVTAAYNKWKSAQQKMISNPNLISRDPEAYGTLNAEANEAYGLIGALSTASKAKAKEIEGNTKLINSSKIDFEGDAHINYLKSHNGIPTSKLIETGADDINQFKFSGPNSKTLDVYNNSMRKGLENKTKAFKYNINDNEYQSGYQVYVPNFNVLESKTSQLFEGMRDADKYSKQYLTQNAARFNDVKNKYETLRADANTEKMLAQYKDPNGNDVYPLIKHPDGTESRMPYLKFDNPNEQSNLKSMFIAQGFLENQPEMVAGSTFGGWKDKRFEMQYKQQNKVALMNIANSAKLTLEQFKATKRSELKDKTLSLSNQLNKGLIAFGFRTQADLIDPDKTYEDGAKKGQIVPMEEQLAHAAEVVSKSLPQQPAQPKAKPSSKNAKGKFD
jgi:hypothetical protein